ncbi:MAG: gluconokinase, GntK/IdnK-type [Vicinamibacterales bacterium]
MVIVLMGPAGAGKTTVGTALAARLSWTFVDADAHHSPASLGKMAAGTPLTDVDRRGWLDSLHARIARALDRRERLVLACSALTDAHRHRLADGLRPVRFVYLKVDRDTLRARLDARGPHVAGPALLDSQLATLEEPDAATALVLDGTSDIDALVGHIRLAFGV